MLGNRNTNPDRDRDVLGGNTTGLARPRACFSSVKIFYLHNLDGTPSWF